VSNIFNRIAKKHRVKYYESQLEQLIETQYQKMYRIAYSYTHSSEDALDVIQDSFQKALMDFSKVKKIDHFQAWFYKILVRTAIDHWRKNKRMPLNFELEDGPGLEFIDFQNDVSYMELRELLSQTPSPEREIIILKFFEGFTLKEIAHILNLNENTVKTKMYRSLDNYKEILK